MCMHVCVPVRTLGGFDVVSNNTHDRGTFVQAPPLHSTHLEVCPTYTFRNIQASYKNSSVHTCAQHTVILQRTTYTHMHTHISLPPTHSISHLCHSCSLHQL